MAYGDPPTYIAGTVEAKKIDIGIKIRGVSVKNRYFGIKSRDIGIKRRDWIETGRPK